MNRSVWLAAIAVALTSAPGFAQPEGTGGGFRTVGGFGGEAQGEVQRIAEVELEGGQRISGQISLRPVTIEADIGRYSIPPDRIKMIRFLKPANQAGAGNPDEPGAAPDGAASRRLVRVVRDGNGVVMDRLNGNMESALIHGKVSTTVGKDIIGDIYVPMDFRITLDVGTLYLAGDALRSLTFTDGRAPEQEARPPAEGPAGADRSPTSFRQGNLLIVFTPVGNRVAIYDLETKRSQAIELASAGDAPIKVSPLAGPGIVALSVSGPKITRIAVAELDTGIWHPQDLRQPAEGHASPIVGPGMAFYRIGRYAYAYSTRAHRWDVAELPEGLRAAPTLSNDGVAIQGPGHIDLFSAATGKWEHIDLRAVLDVGKEPKESPERR